MALKPKMISLAFKTFEGHILRVNLIMLTWYRHTPIFFYFLGSNV